MPLAYHMAMETVWARTQQKQTHTSQYTKGDTNSRLDFHSTTQYTQQPPNGFTSHSNSGSSGSSKKMPVSNNRKTLLFMVSFFVFFVFVDGTYLYSLVRFSCIKCVHARHIGGLPNVNLVFFLLVQVGKEKEISSGIFPCVRACLRVCGIASNSKPHTYARTHSERQRTAWSGKQPWARVETMYSLPKTTGK